MGILGSYVSGFSFKNMFTNSYWLLHLLFSIQAVNESCDISVLGMLPVISTRPLSNFELTLSPDGTRVGHHKCSNLLDYNEIQTKHGFITEETKNARAIGETSPYQYSSALRSAKTLRFYQNLNLEACLWEFSSYYDMSELLTDCSGSIGTDGQVCGTEAPSSLNRSSFGSTSPTESVTKDCMRKDLVAMQVVWLRSLSTGVFISTDLFLCTVFLCTATIHLPGNWAQLTALLLPLVWILETAFLTQRAYPNCVHPCAIAQSLCSSMFKAEATILLPYRSKLYV